MTAVMLADLSRGLRRWRHHCGRSVQVRHDEQRGDPRFVVDAFKRETLVPIVNLSPAEWGKRVRDASTHPGPWPKVSIWQGTADVKVNPANARELVEQWTNVHGIRRAPAKTRSRDTRTRCTRRRRQGDGRDLHHHRDEARRARQSGFGSGPWGVSGTYTPDFKICASYYVSKERCQRLGQDRAMTTHPVDHSIGGGNAPVRSTIKLVRLRLAVLGRN